MFTVIVLKMKLWISGIKHRRVESLLKYGNELYSVLYGRVHVVKSLSFDVRCAMCIDGLTAKMIGKKFFVPDRLPASLLSLWVATVRAAVAWTAFWCPGCSGSALRSVPSSTTTGYL